MIEIIKDKKSQNKKISLEKRDAIMDMTKLSQGIAASINSFCYLNIKDEHLQILENKVYLRYHEKHFFNCMESLGLTVTPCYKKTIKNYLILHNNLEKMLLLNNNIDLRSLDLSKEAREILDAAILWMENNRNNDNYFKDLRTIIQTPTSTVESQFLTRNFTLIAIKLKYGIEIVTKNDTTIIYDSINNKYYPTFPGQLVPIKDLASLADLLID